MAAGSAAHTKYFVSMGSGAATGGDILHVQERNI